MNTIEHIIEPKKLLLTWQSKTDTPLGRTRRLVAEVIRNKENADLRYLIDTPDFTEACNYGFNGYPAFKLDCKLHVNVLDIFKQRIPQRTRADFRMYLEALRINKNAEISDFALLGYSEAKLPEDGFNLLIPFEDQTPPFEFISEIAGFRHCDGMNIINTLVPETKLLLQKEPTNKYDPAAIKVLVKQTGVTLGYINRLQTPAFHKWMDCNAMSEPVIERINGTPQRPKVFMYVGVKP